MVFERNPVGYWFDDYTEIVEELSVFNPGDLARDRDKYHGYGPD